MPAAESTTAVDVWWLPLDMKAALLADLRELLNAEETARASRFAFPELRNRFVAAHGQLREVLAAATGRDARELSFIEGPHGKPALTSGEVEFNLSHSGGAGIVAVASAGCAVGVDIECVKRKTNIAGVAGRFFPREDFEKISALPDGEARQFFFRHWTAREAVMKATGEGMHLNPQSIHVCCENEAGYALVGQSPEEAATTAAPEAALAAAPQHSSIVRRLLHPLRAVADGESRFVGKAARDADPSKWHLNVLRDDYEIVATLATRCPVRVEQHGAL